MNEDTLSSPELDATSEQGAVVPAADSPVKSTDDDHFGFLDVAAKRAFSESEVSQAITIRFLVEKMKEYKQEIALLKPYQVKSYELDRDLQIEIAKNKRIKIQEIASLALTTIGGAGMGLAIKFADKDSTVATLSFVLFAGIVATGVILKVAAK